MVRTIRVCLYRTRMVRKIVPYVYSTKYAYGIEQHHYRVTIADTALPYKLTN